MALKFGDIDNDVENDVDYVLWMGDDEEVELKFEDEVDYNNVRRVGINRSNMKLMWILMTV